MKYLDEYRDKSLVLKLAEKIAKITTKPWTIMEICGGQTHSILKYNLTEFLPETIHFVHGPGCPVCVTPVEMIDKAVLIARQPDVIFTTYGDMLRVPGSFSDLFQVKADGADVRMVFSPLDALKIAEQNPTKKVVFFAVGFETTAPANAMSLIEARNRKLTNYSVLSSHVLVPPAIEALLSSYNTNVQGFIAAGHVCAVMGYEEYIALAEKYKIPIVVAGFEPVDILHATEALLTQLENGTFTVENKYSRVVSKEGNVPARKILNQVYEVVDRNWRGIGMIPKSGFAIKEEFAAFDAEKLFKLEYIKTSESALCKAGDVLRGVIKPTDCKAFGVECTPEKPLGAPMVSTEGACAAYFHYKKR